VGDGLRLAVGTLTAVPVPPPTRVDRAVAGRALLLAPVVGLVLALPAAALAAGVHARVPGAAGLAALLGVGLLAAATHGLHLDGLADTADGWASRRRGVAALAVMRRSDIGPAGVVTLVVVLGTDVAGLAATAGYGRHGSAVLAATLVTAVVTGRAALTLACRRGVPAADSDGLGAAVAGSVPPAGAAAGAAGVLALAATAGALVGGGRTAACLAGGAAAGLAVALAATALAVRRFGGVSGDVLGAVCETATAATVVAVALLLG